jgi:integrase
VYDHHFGVSPPGDARISPRRHRCRRARGALVHGLRHTFATELANADVSVYALMKPLGHESIATSQRYITAAGSETRTAASQTDSTAC